MQTTPEFKIKVTLYIVPKEITHNLSLPFPDLKNHLIELAGTDDIYSNVQLITYQSNLDIKIQKGDNLLFLNNLLSQISVLEETTRQNLLDLFNAQESRTVIDLYAMTQHINHFEVIDIALHGIEETKKTAGALFYLSIAPDCAINSDGDGSLTEDYKMNFFHAGLASGGIRIANHKYYIMDSDLIRKLL